MCNALDVMMQAFADELHISQQSVLDSMESIGGLESIVFGIHPMVCLVVST